MSSLSSSRTTFFARRKLSCKRALSSSCLNSLIAQLPGGVRLRVDVHSQLDDHVVMLPRQTYLISRYSSMPYLEPSLPMPDCLKPPNGIASDDTIPSLTPIIPTSNSSATRQICPMSPEKKYPTLSNAARDVSNKYVIS